MATGGAGASAAAAAAAPTEMPAAYAGEWNCDLKRSDLISPFLSELGVPWLFRKLADNGKVAWTIIPVAGGFTQKVVNAMRKTETTYLFNSAVEVENPDGSKNAVTLTALGDGKFGLAAAGPKGQPIRTTYELVDGGAVLLATISINKADKPAEVVTVKRYFTRK